MSGIQAQDMKVLQVLAGAPHGGAETAFVETCLALQEAGVEQVIATRPNPERVPKLQSAGLKVYELGFGGALDFLTSMKLRRIIARERPGIVQTWMSRAAAKLPAKRPGDTYRVVSRLGGYYKLKHYGRSEYFIANTPDIRRYLIESGIAPDRVRHINNFAEIEEETLPQDRAALATPEGAPLLLALGRLHEVKAFDTLLHALARTQDICLWIAGEGPDRDKLVTLATELGVEDRVRFLGWRSDRAALFAACDVCIVPSRFEPFGAVFAQAWAHNTPLITTNSEGPRQFVTHEDDALMVPIDDVPAMAAAIERLCADPALQHKLAQNGAVRYAAEFTRQRCVQAYLDYYAEMLEARI